MTQIFEGLRSVPSSANTQPWNIVAVQGANVIHMAPKSTWLKQIVHPTE